MKVDHITLFFSNNENVILIIFFYTIEYISEPFLFFYSLTGNLASTTRKSQVNMTQAVTTSILIRYIILRPRSRDLMCDKFFVKICDPMSLMVWPK